MKIPNGYLIKTGGMDGLMTLLEEVRAECKVIKLEKIPQMAAQMVAFSIDTAVLGKNKDLPRQDLFHNLFAYLVAEGHKARAGAAGPTTDWSFSMVVIPVGGGFAFAKSKYLGLTFTQQEAFRDIWEAKKGVEDYHYADGLKDEDLPVDKAKWEERAEVWRSALQDPVPENNGFTFRITDESLIDFFAPGKDAAMQSLLDNLPTFDERLKVLVNSIAVKHRVKEGMQHRLQGDDRPEAVRSAAVVNEALEWLQSTPEPEILSELRMRYSSKMQEEITKKDLERRIALAA